MNWLSEPVRAWIYRVLIALGAVAAVWGWLNQEQIAAILGVVVAVLNVLPAVNTSTKKDSEL